MYTFKRRRWRVQRKIFVNKEYAIVVGKLKDKMIN